MNPTQEEYILKQLRKRIVDITYKKGLSHLSSTLSALPVIFEMYTEKKEDEVFILSSGHAGLALYVVLEHLYGLDAEELLDIHGIHPNRDLKNLLYCSTGSLGLGICIAVGHALADRSKNVWCLVSDGETAEGSVWEALRFKDVFPLENLKVYVNINGLSAYEHIDVNRLNKRLKDFCPTVKTRISKPLNFGFSKGLETHYHRLSEEEYNILRENI